MIQINLGCGMKQFHKPGYVNVDMRHNCQPDVQHDITISPWPFDTNSAVLIEADNILEHIGYGTRGEDLLCTVLNEAHRVLVSDPLNPGRLWFRVPDFLSWPYGAIRDPTHRRFFCAGSVDYWDQSHQTHRNYGASYGYKPWIILNKKIVPGNGDQRFLEVVQAPAK